MTVIVRKAEIPDARALAATLGRAFDDDPVIGWLLPGRASRRRRLPRLFELELLRLYLPYDEVYTTADVAGGALWAQPGQWRVATSIVLRAVPRMAWTLRRRLPLALRTITAIERVHPSQSHWYLALLGTEPTHQGQGIGSALLAPILARCDREGMPAYLESSRESNLGFYHRHGFEVTQTIDLPGGGPRVWPMWRDPQTASTEPAGAGQ